jgi:HipA-like protein
MTKTVKKIKKYFWKEEGMDFSDNPLSSGSFNLLYEDIIIGTLQYDKSVWTFEYTDSFKKNPVIAPIIDFPDVQKKYTSSELWPFFASRIPSINQPYQAKKIKKANIKQNDSVGLLKIFGSETITNPFRLLAL